MADIPVSKNITLFPKQLEFIRGGRGHKLKLAIGSTRCGKSVALAVEAVLMAAFSPPGPLLFTAKTISNAHSNICDVIENVFGKGYLKKYSSKSTEVSLLGRKVFVKGADDASAVEKIKGLTISGAICDEVSTYPEEVFYIITTRLEKKGVYLAASTNPESLTHWLKVHFIDRPEVPLFWMKFTLDDNILVDEAYKEFLRKTLRGAYLQRYYYGEWASAEGIIYTDFGDHLIGDFADHSPSELICGIDFGTQHKTEAVMVASDPLCSPKIWVPKSLCIDQDPNDVNTVSEVGEKIVEWMSPHFPSVVYVDPAALVLKTELQRRLPSGVRVLGANNDVLNGIHYLCRLFYNKEIGIDHSCKQLIKELYSYSWDKKKSDLAGKDIVKKENDDGVDALRYAIYSRFGNRANPVEESRKTGDQILRRNASLPTYKKILGGFNEINPRTFGGRYF